MHCAEADSILRPLQREFAMSYYNWCLDESKKEAERDFPNVRGVRSSVAFLFLEFAEHHSAAEMRDLMSAGIKHFQDRAAGFGADKPSATFTEQSLRQEFINYFSEEIVIHGKPMSSFRVSARERRLREEEFSGRLRFNEDNNRLRSELKRRFQSSGFQAASEYNAGLNYCEKVGEWYLHSSLDVSGKSQLECGHRIAARKAIDTCSTDLCAGINLLSWCGVHPNTRYDLLTESELGDAAASVLRVHILIRESLPKLLAGLHHNIPEELEDARPLRMQKRI